MAWERQDTYMVAAGTKRQHVYVSGGVSYIYTLI